MLRMSEDRMLKVMFLHQRKEITWSWRKLHNDMFNNYKKCINQINKYLIDGACMLEVRNEYRMLIEDLKGRDHLGDLGTGGKVGVE
jgi:hypothetical protein